MQSLYKLLLVSSFLLICTFAKGQLAGTKTWAIMKLPKDGYQTALSGNVVSGGFEDPSFYTANASLGNQAKNNYIKASIASLGAGTTLSFVGTGNNSPKIGSWNASLTYLNYGTFDGTDASGNLTQKFNASEAILSINNAKKIGYFTLGANLNYVLSNYEIYSSSGLMADIGGYYKHPVHDVNVGLSIRNVGLILKPFIGNTNQEIPFTASIGINFKPKYMPVRFFVSINQLQTWNLATAVNMDNLQLEELNFMQNLGRHLNWAVQAEVSPKIKLIVGYNHLLRKELKFENINSFSGISAGFLLKASKLDFSFGHQSIQKAGGFNQFSVFIPLSKKI